MGRRKGSSSPSGWSNRGISRLPLYSLAPPSNAFVNEPPGEGRKPDELEDVTAPKRHPYPCSAALTTLTSWHLSSMSTKAGCLGILRLVLLMG